MGLFDEKSEDQSGDNGKDRIDLENIRNYDHRDGNQRAGKVGYGGLEEFQYCYGNEADGHRPDDLEQLLRDWIILELRVVEGNEVKGNEGNEDEAEGGEDRACQSRNPCPNECGQVDHDRSGSDLGNPDQVGEFLQSQPAVRIHGVLLCQHQHGIAASDGEQADLEKDQEQFEQQHGCLRTLLVL